MNPFFIFLFICTITAILFWFKNASKSQGITALKWFFIFIGLVLVALVVTGRLSVYAWIPLLLAALFRKFALNYLLIPFIKIMAGSYLTKKRPQQLDMDEKSALDILNLPANPSREQIVQAHRKLLREAQQSDNSDPALLMRLEAARAFLIENCEK